MAVALPEGLITPEELGIFAEQDASGNTQELADLIIRMTGVVIRFTAKRPEWTADTIPYEVKVVALDFARRVFNNPQNQTRITTGPLGESYSAEEVVGLALLPHQEELLETFIPEDQSNTSSFWTVSAERPDTLRTPVNYDLVPLHGLGQNDDYTKIPSLTKYLGLA